MGAHKFNYMAKQLCSKQRLCIWEIVHISVEVIIVLSGHAMVVKMETYDQSGKSWFICSYNYITVIFRYIIY